MNRRRRLGLLAVVLVSGAVAGLLIGAASAREHDPPGDEASWTTVFESTLGIEGLTADEQNNLYVAARGGGNPCPVYRVPVAGGGATIVGFLPTPCAPSGLTFGDDGRLYVTGLGAQDQIGVLTPDETSKPTATLFATGVPGANGVAFTEDGKLLRADTARGALWEVQLDRDGKVASPVNCDTTFTADTLCLDNVFVQHPYLEGVDGIALH